MGERTHRSVMNIKVGMLFYILTIILTFFSRRVFLECLGTEFIGLTGMLMNIMFFLSIAELGSGTVCVNILLKEKVQRISTAPPCIAGTGKMPEV